MSSCVIGSGIGHNFEVDQAVDVLNGLNKYDGREQIDTAAESQRTQRMHATAADVGELACGFDWRAHNKAA